MFVVQFAYILSSIFISDFNNAEAFIEEITTEETNSGNDPCADCFTESEDASDLKLFLKDGQSFISVKREGAQATHSILSLRKGKGYPDSLFSPPDFC
ncbi:MAG TPA: hypothetical protein DCD96_00925 [Flavobacteriales bacterium]|nr:hypothetical protein [Flavobacteriales bacterium]